MCDRARMLVLPLPRDRKLARAGLLLGGLALYGVSIALIVLAGLGVMPWTVLEQGLARSAGLSLGAWSIIIGALLLIIWVPLGERPGLGTVANVVLIGVFIDATLAVIDPFEGTAIRILALVIGITLNGVATGAYIGAGMGPGPRDGLTTAIATRTGRSLRLVRTAIEITVVLVGVVLGGQLGLGTIAYALAIGPLMHVFVPLLRLRASDE